MIGRLRSAALVKGHDCLACKPEVFPDPEPTNNGKTRSP